MDLVSRLKVYLDSKQISVTQFADECGIPRPTGSQLLAGRNKKVSDEIIGKIHVAYPDLNVVWLMFGEGNMESVSNIKSSAPQTEGNQVYIGTQSSGNQSLNSIESSKEKDTAKQSEKNLFGQDDDFNSPSLPGIAAYDNTFTFAPSIDNNRPDQSTSKKTGGTHVGANISMEDQLKGTEPDSITLTPGKGKRVTGIVVYYDDCTYESFVPDPNHSHPFMNR